MPLTVREQWDDALDEVTTRLADLGVPEAFWPSVPPDALNWGDEGLNKIPAWRARQFADERRLVGNAKQQGVWINPDAGEQGLNEGQRAWWQALPQWLRAMVDMRKANAQAQQGNQQANIWDALGNNPALWQQMMYAGMNSTNQFRTRFRDHIEGIGDIIGQQLNTNAERINATMLARAEDDRKRDALRDTLAALEGIYGGFSGALGTGLGAIGKGMGQWGAGFSPLGGASGAFGAGGGGGWRILPNGSVVTAQDVPSGIPAPGEIRGGEVNLGAIAGVNPRAAQELAEAGRGAGRQAAGRIRGKFNADAGRQQMAAQGALMGQGAKANLGQLGNALLVAKGVNKNIEQQAKADALVQKAHNQARAVRGKQMGGLVGQLGGLLPKIG